MSRAAPNGDGPSGKRGVCCRKVGDGLQGEEKAMHETFDLIVLDVSALEKRFRCLAGIYARTASPFQS
jgi:hypothetical protein